MKIITKYNRGIVKIIGRIILSAMLFAGLYSCTDDFLERDPLDKISDALVWEDISLMDAYVSETYAQMRSPHSNHYYLSTASDESFARERTPAHLVQRGEINSSSMGRFGYAWPEYYRTITRSNIFTSNVEGRDYSDFTDAELEKLDQLIGEMKFHRAWAYFRLSSYFGGVPLVTKPFTLSDDFMMPRDSYDDVINFIIQDLDEATDLLPLEHSSDQVGRITKGAAMALKSRVLLYYASPLNNPDNDMSRWQDAADAAKAVIDLGIYSLHPDYGELFREEANFNNNEYIYEMVINNQIRRRMRMERDMYPNGMGGWAVLVPSHNQVEAYETANGLYIDEDPDFEFTKFWENRDPRFYATILYNGAFFRDREIELFLPGGLDSFEGPTGPWNASYTGYYNRKMVSYLYGDLGGNNTSSPNWPYIRYAEILLNYAEALYNLGEEGLAREAINEVRSRPSVSMPDVTDSGEDLLKRIMNERQVELFMEEHRFFDIRRWKLTFPEDYTIQKMNYEIDPDSGEMEYFLTDVIEFRLPEHTYRLPIPLDEITRNPLLEQNPGYN